MARLLSFALARDKNALASDHVWTMLFEVHIPGAPAVFRMANYDQDVVFHGLNFIRFGVQVDSLEEATSAALVHLRLTPQNVSQELVSLLENYWLDAPDWQVVIWQIDAMQPNEVPFGDGEVFAVQSVSSDTVMAVLDIVAEGLTLTKLIPKRRYNTTSGFPFIPRRG